MLNPDFESCRKMTLHVPPEVLEHGKFSMGHRLPNGMLYYCAVTINGSHVFVGGSARTFLVDVDRWEWVKLERGLFYPSCGLINSLKNGKEVVMASENKGLHAQSPIIPE